MRHPVFGPRLIFKDDRDSTIGRGAWAYAPHMRPQISDICRSACAAAPMPATLVKVTEAWRDIRDTPDDHEDFNAVDITVEMPGGMRATKAEYDQMAARMKIFLGPDYGYLVHGEGSNLHIHFRFRRD